jgi:serine/threonine protein kinase
MKREMAKKGHAVHHDPQQFAIKYLKIDNAQTATEGIMEATKLVKVSHPNIVSLREQFFKNRKVEEEEEEEKPQGFIASILGSAPKLTNPKLPAYDLCLVMERCDGDLQELIRSWAGSGEQNWGEDPGTPEKMRILAQITAAVAHIHEVAPVALIHRDLKPENVFIAHVEVRIGENSHGVCAQL